MLVKNPGFLFYISHETGDGHYHHESICWDLDYITEIHDRLILVLGWMNSDMPAWLEKVDNFSKVVDEIRNSSAGLKV